jgi:hypothetical protein
MCKFAYTFGGAVLMHLPNNVRPLIDGLAAIFLSHRFRDFQAVVFCCHF